MKKNITTFIVFLFLLPSILIAQIVELNNQSKQFVDIKLVQPTFDGRWLLSGNREPSDNSYSYLETTDLSGALQFNSEDFELENVEKFIYRAPSGYVLCKDDNTTTLTRFTIATNNNISFSQQITFNNDIDILNINTLNNGKVVVVGRRIVGQIDFAFVRIYEYNLSVYFYEDYSDFGYFDDIIIAANGEFVLTGSFGSSTSSLYGGRVYNSFYQQQGDVLEEITAGRFFSRGYDEYFMLQDQTLFAFDKDFQIVNSISLEDYGERIDMEVDFVNGYLLFQNEEEGPMILKINNDLEVVDSFEFEDKFFRVHDMHLFNNEIGVGGYLIPNVPFNHSPFLYPSTSGFFKTISKWGIVDDEDIDLEIIDVKIEDHQKTFNCGSPGIANAYWLDINKIKVSLVNNGTTRINNVTLLSKSKGVENCIAGTFDLEKDYIHRHELTLLQLEPGDTIDWRISPIEFFQNMNDTISVELCVWHTSVDNQRDQNHDNNYFCGEVELKKGYAELPIIEPNKEEVLIYPNPIDDLLTVSLKQAPYEPTIIEFYDFLGRKFGEDFVIAPRAKYKEFDVTQIPNGYYFIRVSNDLINEGFMFYVK